MPGPLGLCSQGGLGGLRVFWGCRGVCREILGEYGNIYIYIIIYKDYVGFGAKDLRFSRS